MSRHFPLAELVLAWFCGLSSRPRVLSLDRCGASGANGNSGDAVSRDEVGFVGTIWRGKHLCVMLQVTCSIREFFLRTSSKFDSQIRIIFGFPVVNDCRLDWNVDDISCQMINIISYLCWDGGITPLGQKIFFPFLLLVKASWWSAVRILYISSWHMVTLAQLSSKKNGAKKVLRQAGGLAW